jgi:hypothetical protein
MPFCALASDCPKSGNRPHVKEYSISCRTMPRSIFLPFPESGTDGRWCPYRIMSGWSAILTLRARTVNDG